MSLMRWEPFRDSDEFFRRAWPGQMGRPDVVDVNAIRAETRDGVLMVHLPKQTLEKPRPVEIKVG